MKSFISVSGTLSTEIGGHLSEWMAAVLQHVEPWIAVEDISKGAHWPTKLAESLSDTDCGIIVLCPDNLNSPWLMYEAGVIAARTKMERVAGLLIDVAPSAVTPPLGLFQLTRFDRDDVRKLIHRLNEWTNSPRTAETIDRVFNALWPEFETKVRQCIASGSTASPTPRRDHNAMIEEILNLTRDVYRRTCASAPEDRIGVLQKELRNSTTGTGLLDGLLASPRTAVESVSFHLRPTGPTGPTGLTGAVSTRHSSATTFQLQPAPAGVMPTRDSSGG
jgi:hypothetical protein